MLEFFTKERIKMKNRLNNIRFLFGWKTRNRMWVKSFVARFSRGNVRLQLGKFMTQDEYEARRQKVLSYDFS